jgi:hypothetical protein
MTSWLVPWPAVTNKGWSTKKPTQAGRLFDWQADKFIEPPGPGPSYAGIWDD